MDNLNAIRDKDKIILHLCADIGSDTNNQSVYSQSLNTYIHKLHDEILKGDD